MVIPYMMSVAAMVRLLCVMMMNCESLENFRMMLLNLSMLASSSGASTSSKRYRTGRLQQVDAEQGAVAVRVFSPPDNWEIDKGALPFGLARSGRPESVGLSGLSGDQVAIVVLGKQGTENAPEIFPDGVEGRHGSSTGRLLNLRSSAGVIPWPLTQVVLLGGDETCGVPDLVVLQPPWG